MSNYTEDKLVQETTADYLHDVLGWDESVYALQGTAEGQTPVVGL